MALGWAKAELRARAKSAKAREKNRIFMKTSS
jgi:hypothetical protein